MFVFGSFVVVLFAGFVLIKKCYIYNAIRVKAKVLESEYHYRGFNDTKFEYEIDNKKYQAKVKTLTLHKKGETYEINVDPMNLEHIVRVKDKHVGIILMILTLVFLPFIIRG